MLESNVNCVFQVIISITKPSESERTDSQKAQNDKITYKQISIWLYFLLEDHTKLMTNIITSIFF